MCVSKKGISAHQLHRTLEVQYNTAWFMEHRIREAMRSGDLTEFDFRYDNRVRLGVDDVALAERAFEGISGKRLMYQGRSSKT